MVKKIGVASLFGVVGLIVGCLIVWGAVSTWTQLSSRWISAGFVFPLLAMTFSLWMYRDDIQPYRTRFRLALMPVAALLATAGNYLAWIITSRTWFADKIPPEHQGFLFQLMNPGALPAYFSRSSSGTSSFEQSWVSEVVVGLIAGPLAFWLLTRDDQ